MSAAERSSAVRILLVDDNDELRDLVQRSLERRGYAVLAYPDGTAALRGFTRYNPDVVVLDLGLPDIDGIDVCQQMREIAEIPIVMLTARDTVQDRVEGLRAGAEDYIVKPFAMEELAARIEVVLRRQKGDDTVLTHEDLWVDLEGHVVKRGEIELSLTPKEFLLLVTLLRHQNRVVNRSTLTNTLWPGNERGDDGLLDGHVANLRQKTEVGGGRRLIQTVRGVGFVVR